MSAPYWGQLPGSTTGQTRARRLSDGMDAATDQRSSLDAPAPNLPASNRVSIQTTKSDAPTESTMSPFVSPTASNFQGHGLTPRPPSLPYGANQYPPEFIENRRRRRSRNQEQDDEYAALAAVQPPPAAPDAPPAPSTPASITSRYPPPAGGHSRRMSMDDDDYHRPAVARKEGRVALEESAMPRTRVVTDPARGRNSPLPNGRRTTSAAEQSLQRSKRRTAANASAGRRNRALSDVRSPLQKLEQTLDNISKEDKRARVEAAERAARERAAARDADKDPRTGPRHHDGPLSQNPPGELRRQPATGGDQIPIPVPAEPGIQRNLSFRERAARSDMKPPNGFEPPEAPQPPSGRTQPRSGTNKLKKTPPTDPWPTRVSEDDDIYETGAPAATRTGSQDDSDDDLPEYPAKLKKSPGQRRADQVLGRDPGVDGSPRDEREGTRQRLVDLVHRVRDRNQPAQDVYQHPPYLDEWKKATVGALTGALLDLDDAGPAAAPTDKNPAWWERPQSRHRSNSLSSRPVKAEAFEGEYAETNGMRIHGREAIFPSIFSVQSGDVARSTSESSSSGLPFAPQHLVPPSRRAKARGRRWDGLRPYSPSPSAASDSQDSLGCFSLCSNDAAFARHALAYTSPTRFKPPLYLKCGPLLRFCGIRRERVPGRTARDGTPLEREIWRGSIMIVTTDTDSSYDIAPTLRLFVQPIELLPPPPREIRGDEPLAPEFVDPIAGHPKLGRKGETLYVRPVDHLEEARDVSRNETDDGLFEKTRSPPDAPLPKGATDPPGSFAARRKRAEADGEKLGKYRDVRGFRLHAERGYTFWRFNVEVELRDRQQRIAYRINRGPSTGFWVPARGQSMNVMFYSCNGFSLNVDTDEFTGPDPMWRDVLNTHQSQPFHVMIGGGDQIYNDRCMQDVPLFRGWLAIKNPLHKHSAPFTTEMREQLEHYYLERYCAWFSQGLFGMANAQIPMVNMWDDHDIIDGFGSYPHHFMSSPVFAGLGNVAFKYYLLFQHQTVVDETDKTEPSWIMGTRPGPYITELSRSLFISLGGRLALLAVDARTERTRQEILCEDSWKRIMDRCYSEIDKGKIDHLLVLLPVPIAYPRLVWLENILTSRVMDPVKALAKLGMFGGLLNRFDGGVEVLDDLDDHWTAKSHKRERAIVVEDLQDLAADKSVRVTILSGDVHLAAVGQFYSHPKFGLAKHKDFRYMPNVISSAIVNAPPPDLLADVLNKRNKVHHFDKETEEDMIPLFGHGVDGKPRNNKHLLPHRNWCAIREYVPGHTPLPTPDASGEQLPVSGTPALGGPTGLGRKGSVLRRLSRPKTAGADGVKDRTRPPVSGGLLRSLSRRAGIRSADDVGRPATQPGIKRSPSSASVASRFGGLFRRRSTSARQEGSPINGGGWNPETDGSNDVGMRGGLGSDYSNEFMPGDDNYFTAKPQHHHHQAHPDANPPPVPPKPVTTTVTATGATPMVAFPARQHPYSQTSSHHQHTPTSDRTEDDQDSNFTPKPFLRTPTTLSTKQRKALASRNPADLVVDLRGALEVTLNVEISPKDPGGSTVPYRLVVPKLWYEYEGEEEEEGQGEGVGGGDDAGRRPGGGIKRLLSLKRKDG
ncbi:hypothetical protein VTJ49DRAFT_2425 [Mycothermus thermophilus]|uniref:PhoD-like phosphatase domain-containing protein n=1 Tax=Humicola insolens TaxID=85995 RepID=A0ABR3V9Z7_HUMIN